MKNNLKQNTNYFLVIVCMVANLLMSQAILGQVYQDISPVYIDFLDTNRCSRYLLNRYKKEAIQNPTPENLQKVKDEEEYIKKKCTCDVKRWIFLDKISEPGIWKVVMQKYRREGNDCVPIGKYEPIYWVEAPPEEMGSATAYDEARYFDPITILIDSERENRFENSTAPFDYITNAFTYYNWAKGEDIKGNLCLIVPSVRTQKVWVITPNNPENRPIWASNLFISSFVRPEDEKYRETIFFLMNILSLCIVKDPYLMVLRAPEMLLPSFVIAGNPNDKDYILCFGLSGTSSKFSSYEPIDLFAGESASHQYIRSLISNRSYFTSPLGELLDDWRETGRGQIVKAILPENCQAQSESYYTPLALLGNPGATQTEPTCIRNGLINRISINLLVENELFFEKWTAYGKKYLRWFSEIYNPSINDQVASWLAWLALADTSINIIAETYDLQTVCFISEEDPYTLWSWIQGRQTGPPEEYRLLKGDDVFILTGEKQKNYIRGLCERDNVSSEEREFFLVNAYNPNGFRLLDFFEKDRILLYKKMNESYKSAYHFIRSYRIGENLDESQPIDFYVIDGQPGSEINTLRPIYKNWARPIIQDEIEFRTSQNLEFWFGPKRFGICKEPIGDEDNITMRVFLGPYKRELSGVHFSELKKLIKKDGNIVYMAPKIDLKTDLFCGWLSQKWQNPGIWRADPLGYFDRVVSRSR
ncbi:MAG: hypothetical protein DKINENOH_04867 [bacterium]|nr:hypothetical protein [bacterium]